MDSFPYLSPAWALALLAATGWTTAFSLLNHPLRGLRNLGLLACYAIGVAMAVVLPWRAALATWVLFALAGALLYIAYDAWSRIRERAAAAAKGGAGEESAGSLLAPLRDAVVAWPIMIPEAVEYALADMGVLRARALLLLVALSLSAGR